MRTFALGQLVLILLCGAPSLAEEKKQGEHKASGDWVQLFNGKDLTGWNVAATRWMELELTKDASEKILASWTVKDGILSGTAGNIKYERGQFADFHLRLEARSNHDHGSWVCVRAPDPNAYSLAWVPAGYHVVVGAWPKGNFTGDLTRLPSRVKEQLVQPDKWFTLEVIARGDHFVVKVDGKTTLDFTDAKKELFSGEPKKAVSSGFIALSVSGRAGVTEFRKIEVKHLPRDAKAPDKK